MNKKELLEKAVHEYGYRSQIFMAIEEMGELLQALSKAYRSFGDKEIENVIEEIADVTIMLEQMHIIFSGHCTESVLYFEEKKLRRLAKSLGVTYEGSHT